MGRKPDVLYLTKEERAYLELQSKARTIRARIVTRANILLLKSEGYSIDVIADKVGLNRKSVVLCLDKYRQGGVEYALVDAPGRGRKAEITEDEKQWIIALAKKSPQCYGYEAQKWSYARLAMHIHETAEAEGHLRLSTIHKTTVNTILDEAGIKPYTLKYDKKGNARKN